MKTRKGFVSNSSSSSFVILKKDITGEILKWIEDSKSATPQLFEYWKRNCNYKLISEDYTEEEILKYFEEWIESEFYNFKDVGDWSIGYDSEGNITGYTIIDNFNFQEFLDILKVPYSSGE